MKRVAQAIRNLFRREREVASPSSSSLLNPTNPTIISSNQNNPQKIQASQHLRDAVRELSQNTAIPITSPPREVVASWMVKDPQELPTDQLEELARLHYEGSQGIQKDLSKAVELWTIASRKGSVEGKFSRALCLKNGVGIARNLEEALRDLLELAEDKNYNLAHYSAAVMLEKGEGTAPDLVKAFEHYKKAARGGVQPALHNIANAYAYGRGVKQSDHNALLYYEAAVESGDPSSHFTLGSWYYEGKGGLKEDKKKAVDLRLFAAKHNHPAANFNVGVAYLTGDGIPAEPEKAVPFFEKAIAMGIVEAALNLSKMYMEGKGVAKDLNKAKEVLQRFRVHPIAIGLLEEIDARIKQGE